MARAGNLASHVDIEDDISDKNTCFLRWFLASRSRERTTFYSYDKQSYVSGLITHIYLYIYIFTGAIALVISVKPERIITPAYPGTRLHSVM